MIGKFQCPKHLTIETVLFFFDNELKICRLNQEPQRIEIEQRNCGFARNSLLQWQRTFPVRSVSYSLRPQMWYSVPFQLSFSFFFKVDKIVTFPQHRIMTNFLNSYPSSLHQHNKRKARIIFNLLLTFPFMRAYLTLQQPVEQINTLQEKTGTMMMNKKASFCPYFHFTFKFCYTTRTINGVCIDIQIAVKSSLE